jgi:hypothetical protein
MTLQVLSTRNIYLLLFFLVLLDLFLAAVCLISPDWWFALMHGASYDDPAGLVRRMGAVWLAFLVFQLIALIKWKEYPALLVLVAGIRLTEIFSDWVYWFFAEQLSWFGHFGLLVAPPANLLFGIYLIKAYYEYKYLKE